MKYVNLTPHKIVVVKNECPNKVNSEKDIEPYVIAQFPPNDTVARVQTKRVKVSEIDGIPVYRTFFGEVENLPAPEKDTIYIVSILVLQAVKGKRTDVICPDTTPPSAVRDSQGKIVAVKGFQTI